MDESGRMSEVRCGCCALGVGDHVEHGGVLWADVDGQHVDEVGVGQVVVGHGAHIQQPRPAGSLTGAWGRPQQPLQSSQRGRGAAHPALPTIHLLPLLPPLPLLL